MSTTSPSMRLSDLPLWRLLVALDDAERTAGPDCPTARILVRIIRRKLRGERFLIGKEADHASD